MTTPAFRILADGSDITAQIRDRLVSIRITDEAGQVSDSLEITVDDREKRMPLPRTGAWIRVWLGYSTNGELPVYMGAYAVDDCDLSCGPRSMVIRASAAATAPELMKEQRTQSWHQTTLGQVVTTIAQRNALKPVIKGSLASVEIKHEDQTSESDQAFLTRLAERYKATIKPADGKLVVQPRGSGEGFQDFTITEKEVTSWRANVKNRGAYGQVAVRYLDRKTQKEKIAKSGKAAGKLPTFEEKQLAKNKEEAEKQAASRLQSLTSGEVRISLELQGRPRASAEGLITLKDFRPEVDGTWNIKSITHSLDSKGYRTSIECGTKGEENDDWMLGESGGGVGTNGVRPGANNGKPASQKANLIARSAEQLRGMNTRGGPDGGNNACLFAVNRVLRNAGITPPWGNSNYVPTAQQVLAGGAGTLLSGPEPGAIAIMRDYGSPPYPHIGVVGTDGSTIISNSSSRGSFSWAAGEGSYTSTYGRTPIYYRLR
jgi:phage protein D